MKLEPDREALPRAVEHERALRTRLRQIVADSSQSRVARATNTPQASVSRYLKDRRVPADFCARIAKTLGVNPCWLLLGEGAPYLADVDADADKT